MISRILDISAKSKQYMANFTAHVVEIVEKGKTVDFNRVQMLGSTDAEDKPLTHAKTKSVNLSKAYAKRTGKTRPNLWLNGDFQSQMFLTMPNEKEYFITSKDYKTKWLAENYGQIFGVSPKNQPKAQKINDSAVINDYMKKVFN